MVPYEIRPRRRDQTRQAAQELHRIEDELRGTTCGGPRSLQPLAHLAVRPHRQRFREDLFYRINVVPIEMPPLRARRDDIPLLAQHFLELAATLHGKPVKRMDQSGLTLLMQHDWPGNVRELKNSMERLVILSEQECISVDEVSDILPASRRVAGHYRRGATLKDMVASAERDIVVQALEDNEGRVSRTAETLGVERSHLYKKMKALGIDHRADG